ncbi:MAG: M81 family metallopeptidase [Alphaproteobacteria bacterium]|nr:M81 family metallopeptidase [Alphaproteobacteria bacterium]
MRLFVAALGTETNTFAPLPVDRSAFERAFYAPPGRHPETPTLTTAPIVAARVRARRDGFTLIEGTAAWAEPAGLVARGAYEGLRDEILGQLSAAMPVDVALFGLHGAMVADGYEDCEGDLLARARPIVGPNAILGAEYDLHCHLTPKRVAAANLSILFKEFPHTDFLARAEELVDLALRAARREIRPVSALFDCRSLGGGYMTSHPTGRAFVERVRALEGRDGILSVSIGHGFYAADVPEVGCKVLVIADGDKAKAAALAETLGRELLALGRSGIPPHVEPADVIATACSHAGSPVVFADRWDNPGGGVPGDGAIMIEELLRHPDVPSAIGVLWDPIAVEFCRSAGAGGHLWLRIGGKSTPVSGRPVDAHVVVRAVSDDLVIPFEQSLVSFGPAAAVSIGGLDIVLGTKRTQTFAPEAFTRLGIDLSRKKVVVVKSSNHFHAAFSKIAAAIHHLDTGGPFPPDPTRVTYTRVRRPIAPLDADPWAGTR